MPPLSAAPELACPFTAALPDDDAGEPPTDRRDSNPLPLTAKFDSKDGPVVARRVEVCLFSADQWFDGFGGERPGYSARNLGDDLVVTLREVPHAEVVASLGQVEQPHPIATTAKHMNFGGEIKTQIARVWSADTVAHCRLCSRSCVARSQADGSYRCLNFADREVAEADAPLYQLQPGDNLEERSGS